MRRWPIVVLLVLVAAVSLFLLSGKKEGIQIASWNLQVFGDAKASNPVLMRFYADKIRQYDVVFLQELRDADASSFNDLCALLENYSCVLSSRAGRSVSKEQYGVIYHNSVSLAGLHDYTSEFASSFERPPLKVMLSLNQKNITFYVVHLKPSDVTSELLMLERLVEKYPAEYVVVLGDLNADCDYYTPRRRVAFSSWFWAIGDKEDTTTSSRDCAYDRIIMNDRIADAYIESGVDSAGVNASVSDHYLVWVSLDVS